MFAYFAPSTSTWSARAFFFSIGATFALTRISFKLLALLNPTIGTFSKTFTCSMSGVNSKCISDKIFLSFEHPVKSRKFIFALEYSAVNFMVG